MKKIYVTPEVILKKVYTEGMMQPLSTGTGGSWEGGDARDNSNWEDEEESDNIWED